MALYYQIGNRKKSVSGIIGALMSLISAPKIGVLLPPLTTATKIDIDKIDMIVRNAEEIISVGLPSLEENYRFRVL